MMPDSTARPEDVVQRALYVLYSYTSDSANPPIEGRSVTRAAGLVALAALVAERDTLRQQLDAERGSGGVYLGAHLDYANQRASDAERERDAAQERAAQLAATEQRVWRSPGGKWAWRCNGCGGASHYGYRNRRDAETVAADHARICPRVQA